MKLNLNEIKEKIKVNHKKGLPTYNGLSTSEISEYNRVLMFGENDEAFPSEMEWSRIVD